MIIVNELAQSIEREVKQELLKFSEEYSLVDTANYCIQKIFELDTSAPSLGVEAHLKRYYYAIQILQIQIETQHIKTNDLDKITKIAETSLQIAGVKEGSSIGHLYEELYNCRGNLLLQSGKHLGARWEILLGKRYLPQNIAWTNGAISEAITMFQMGYAYHAQCGFKRLLELDLEPNQSILLKYQYLKACRLSGNLAEADHFVTELFSTNHFEEESRNMFLWEKTWITMSQLGKFDPSFKKALSSNREFPNEPYLSLLMLLVYAHQEGHEYIKKLPTTITIRRRYQRKLTQADKILFDILDLLHELYDADIPMKARLAKVTPLIDQVAFLHPEYQLLFFLGLARWSSRYRQKGFAHFALSTYQDISQRMSHHQSNDVLKMAEDLDGLASPLWYINDFLTNASENPAPQSMLKPIGRRFSVWMSYTRLGIQLLSSQKTPREKASLFVEAILKNFIDESVTITGPYAKSMQLLSQFLANILGIDYKYRNSLVKLYASIPQNEAIDLAAVFRSEFHKELSDVFNQWDKRPSNGGSISQVFRAELKDGRQVVVKVKHPDIERQAQHDWNLFYRFLLPIGRRYHRAFSQENFDWLKKVFYDELDLGRETEMMITFRKIFENDPAIKIPEPIVELCSKKVITMEYVEGNTIDHLIEHGSQDEKNRVGQVIYRFHLTSSLGHNLNKVDYFFANFLYTENTVIFMDFGRILSFHKDKFKSHRELLTSMLNNPETPLPSHLSRFEQNVYGVFHEFVQYWLSSDAQILYVEDFEKFVDKVSEAFFKEIGKNEIVRLEEFAELEGLFGLTYCMSKLRTKNNWGRTMKYFLNKTSELEGDKT